VGYYIRILSPSEKAPSIASLSSALAQERLACTLVAESGEDDNWTHIVLAHEDGPEIAAIERNISSTSDLVSAEIDEFLEEIADCKPTSAAEWLTEYLPTIKTIYAFQVLHGADIRKGWDILRKVNDLIFAQVGGILQADGEGFTNEDGYHILWQFSDSAKGPWWMSVLKNGEWTRFQMDLGNKNHREAFLRGEVPNGAKIAK
jgi:hypothetical protein